MTTSDGKNRIRKAKKSLDQKSSLEKEGQVLMYTRGGVRQPVRACCVSSGVGVDSEENCLVVILGRLRKMNNEIVGN